MTSVVGIGAPREVERHNNLDLEVGNHVQIFLAVKEVVCDEPLIDFWLCEIKTTLWNRKILSS